MRDLALVLFFATFLPIAFRFPIVGYYLWIWVAILNPHRMVYGFISGASLNQLIAVWTVLAWLISSEPKKLAMNRALVLLILFAGWFTLTTYTVGVSPAVTDLWDRHIKSVVLVFLGVILINTRERAHAFIWVFCIALGYFGARNGALTVLSGGQSLMGGPPSSMISDNNALALALVLTLPLLNYLRLHSKVGLIRIGLMFQMGLTALGVLGSYSRGGLVAMAAVGAYLWLKSRSRFAALIALIAVAIVGYNFMPERFLDRMSTISTASEDSSFQQRIMSWTVALNVASDFPLGVGFDGAFQPRIWDRYFPEFERFVAHSIYFQVLGDHGYIGLGLYLTMLLTMWLNCSEVRRATKAKPELLWLNSMAAMLQVCMVGFMTGGAALSMAYYDGFLILVGFSATLTQLLKSYSLNALGLQPKKAAESMSEPGRGLGSGRGAASLLIPRFASGPFDRQKKNLNL